MTVSRLPVALVALLALVGAGLTLGPAPAASQTAAQPGPPATRAPATSTQRTSDLKLSAEAENARRLTDERLKRRDNAARRSLQGICKGC